jgi:cation diffusion facilitator CzcD-associated flavoprotein CzcO
VQANIRAKAAAARIVIVGAGMSGICMAIKLIRAGFVNVQLYEKGATVGGTWRENQYPGLHCDVPSHHYVYSFEPNPNWSQAYSPGPEIQRYFERTANKYGITARTRFNAKVVHGEWDGAHWNVVLEGGDVDVADVLISATGFLHVASHPDIPGAGAFSGAIWHTTRWNQDVELSDKRIGVIGTGSTSTQIVCALSGKVKQLVVFQRTAQWVVKIINEPISEKAKSLFRRFPALMGVLYRYHQYKLAKFAAGAIGGESPKLRRQLVDSCATNLASVRDPELRRKLTPDYEVGCKRLVMSPDFYEKVQHPSVEVITARIERIEAGGVRTADDVLHALDVLVLATGFDMSAFLRPMQLTGEGGYTLDQAWLGGPYAYRSMMMPRFPNFFMFTGPYSPAGNISNVLMSELMSKYMLECIKLIVAGNIALSPKVEATDALMKQYRSDARKTVWASGCRSYYLDKDGVPILYPYSPTHFVREMRKGVNLADFSTTPLAVKSAAPCVPV